MTPELWQRLKPLYDAALKAATQNRVAFINGACGEDLELKAQLERLLEAEQQVTGSLDETVANSIGIRE